MKYTSSYLYYTFYEKLSKPLKIHCFIFVKYKITNRSF